ncbi:MAG: ATP-dependent DNA ligase, partial [Acidimicrobiia bacterium]|nr:ATP-dependent DNA ligase [Acidimicrobiia bacterium]
MLLQEVVGVSNLVASTRSRKLKTELLAGMISRSDEPGVLVALLAGEPRQGKIGVGYASAYGVQVDTASESTVTVGDVDVWLTDLAGLAGPGSVARRTDSINRMFARCTEAERGYLRQILTGGIRQGALEGVVIEAIAIAAAVDADLVRRAVMLGGALPTAAEAAMDGGEEALSGFRMEVFRPVRPMLASTANDVTEAISGLSIVDWKLDGARIQVHRTGQHVRIFTRNLNDVTARLQGIVATALGLPIDSLIADGEALAVGPDGRPLRFQATMSQFGAHEIKDETPLSPFFFDLLQVDGEDLLEVPLVDRLARLHAIVPEGMRVPILVTDDPAEAQAALDA